VMGMLAGGAWAEGAGGAAPSGSIGKLPIKELTIFKDGHALVLHAGKLPTNEAGNVVLDYLPSPVLGTFWAASGDAKVKLAAVTSGQQRVQVERTALVLRELLEANVGAVVSIKEIAESASVAGAEYSGTIAGVPTRSAEELEATSPPNSDVKLPQKGNLLVLKTGVDAVGGSGTRVVDIARIQNVTFRGEYKKTAASEELRNLMTLKLNWPDNKPARQADVNIMYIQKGIRWIPNYKFTLDGKGEAAVQLQATVINELYDLDDVAANLVIGVPSIAFADVQDPIGLQKAVAQLSAAFQQSSQTAYSFSNAIMSQSAAPMGRFSETRAVNPGTAADLGPEVGTGGKNEDQFIFPVKHITLKKGERMVVPITEFKLSYKDVFTLDLPFAPPPEVWRGFQNQQQAEIAKLFSAPKFMHVLRMANKTEYPITTAPALVFREGKVLGQVMTKYTPIGGELELTLTTAVDITVKKTDREVDRKPRAEVWEGNEFTRINLEGSIAIANRRGTPVEIEVTRNILGKADKADNDGKVEMLNLFEDRGAMPNGYGDSYPYWWGWYSWPNWWSRFNGIGQIGWKATLEPGKALELKYEWHYYWR
jgi:hypothetical protein